MLLDLLYDKSCANIVIVLDDDAYEDAVRIYNELNFGNLRDRIRIVTPPQGYDPSKIFETLGKDGIIALLRTSRVLTRAEIY